MSLRQEKLFSLLFSFSFFLACGDDADGDTGIPVSSAAELRTGVTPIRGRTFRRPWTFVYANKTHTQPEGELPVRTWSQQLHNTTPPTAGMASLRVCTYNIRVDHDQDRGTIHDWPQRRRHAASAHLLRPLRCKRGPPRLALRGATGVGHACVLGHTASQPYILMSSGCERGAGCGCEDWCRMCFALMSGCECRASAATGGANNVMPACPDQW